MKKLLFLIAIFCVLKANAQNYLITFSGSGAATTVSTVKVENLTARTSLTVNGSDILRLTGTVGISQFDYEKSSGIKIYPNPMIDNSTVEIYPPVAGVATISVYDMTGKPVAQIQSYLENFRQEFRLSGTKNGFYLINVKGNAYQFSGKLLCNGKSNGTISIEKVNTIIQAVDEKISKKYYKGAQATVDMPYSTGDRLEFTGISGIFSTVRTDIPSEDKTITFYFIACSDGDNNNYPVVEIGAQVWMAGNLKTTKYNDVTTIPLVIDNTTWTNMATPGYCWYSNDEATYKNPYGALYNWYAVNKGTLCPLGWHVPTDAEWTTLTTYLGGTSVAGGKMKESGTTHWSSPNSGATNLSGFTGLPGGWRSSTPGDFNEIGVCGEWWSSTENAATTGWSNYLDYWYQYIYRENINKVVGLSVRCLKN